MSHDVYSSYSFPSSPDRLPSHFELSNGVMMPTFGLGTWLMSDSEAQQYVQFALQNGYPMIDSAAIYHNEIGIGEGIKASGVPREKFWITSKVSYPTSTPD
jgi:diketogulonate reductase-like aldo/keto reductase